MFETHVTIHDNEVTWATADGKNQEYNQRYLFSLVFVRKF